MDGFGADSTLGKEFHRDGAGGKSQAYRECRTNAEKKAFRQKWASVKLAEKQQIREREQSFKRVDITEGDYRSLRWLIKEEGPLTAKWYFEKCLKLGGAWIQYDQPWERWTVLVMHARFKEKFTEAWRLREKWFSTSSTSADAPPDPEEAEGTASGSAKPPAQPSAKAKAKGKAKAGGAQLPANGGSPDGGG